MDTINLHVTNYIFNKFKNNTKKDEFRPCTKFYRSYLDKFFFMFKNVKNYKCNLVIFNAYTSENLIFRIKNIELLDYNNISSDAKLIYNNIDIQMFFKITII